MCDNPIVCKDRAAFLKDAFEGYDLKYMTGSEVLNEGGSGKAVRLNFEKRQRNDEGESVTVAASQAVFKMKTGRKKLDKVDNLFREGLVGMKMNVLADVFPVFVRTHSLFLEDVEGPYTIDGVTYQNYDDPPTIPVDCVTFGKQAIMIEYVEGKQFKDLYRKRQFRRDLIPVLFQLYYALGSLGLTYTHYDLHTANVLLTRPDPDKCIRFEYTLNDKDRTKIIFYSKFVAKIIDYGRSYVARSITVGDQAYDSIDMQSVETVKECNTPECGLSGTKCGFRNYRNPNHAGLGFRTSNVSHDLRLLNYVVKYLNNEKKGTHYWHGPPVAFHEGEFSTVEIKETGLEGENPRINNVNDALLILAGMLLNKAGKKNKEDFQDQDVLGTLRVDGVNPWTFEMKKGFGGKQKRHSSQKKSFSAARHRSRKRHV